MKVLIAVAAVIAVALAQGPPGPPPFLEGAPKATIDAWNALVQTFGADTEGQINDAINGFIAQHPEIKVRLLMIEEFVRSYAPLFPRPHYAPSSLKNSQMSEFKLSSLFSAIFSPVLLQQPLMWTTQFGFGS